MLRIVVYIFGRVVYVNWCRISHSTVCDCHYLMKTKKCIHFLEATAANFGRFVSFVHLEMEKTQTHIRSSSTLSEYLTIFYPNSKLCKYSFAQLNCVGCQNVQFVESVRTTQTAFNYAFA